MPDPVLFAMSSALGTGFSPDAISRNSTSGAATKHVKWKGASGSGRLCPDAADSAWMLVRRGVVSKRWARSSGVLSVKWLDG